MLKHTVALIALAASVSSAQNSFTYQGTLNHSGLPADGDYEMRFVLWDDLTPGAPDNLIASTGPLPVTVVDGLFTVNVDLGDSRFQHEQPLFMEVDVRTVGTTTFTPLTPRQEIAFTPRSFYAQAAGVADDFNLPITKLGGDADMNAFDSLFYITHAGTTGTAIRGDGQTTGVLGLINDFSSIPAIPPGGVGVAGLAENTGVFGGSEFGSGVRGTSLNGIGGSFESRAPSDSPFATSLYAYSNTGVPAGYFTVIDSSSPHDALISTMNSQSSNVSAVHGMVTSTNPGSFSAGVYGENNGTGGLGVGVMGTHDAAGWGIYGSSGAGGFAAVFAGDVSVFGTLSKSGGSFKIDHPLDPENMTLSHSFVESPDMKNIYDGVVTLDKNGQAIVSLPTYFNALNQDFRYQLTCIGGYAPVYIAAEIQNQQFAIAGGTPGLKVSWQVTGIRHDAWANQNRIPTEEYKSDSEKGKYLNPEAFNQPKEKGIGYIQSP
ncbi:MAG: hypothetical protein ACWA5W_01575 [Phycisphaerales bacterium]